MNTPAGSDIQGLALMGSGGENDRLRFKLVVSLLWR